MSKAEAAPGSGRAGTGGKGAESKGAETAKDRAHGAGQIPQRGRQRSSRPLQRCRGRRKGQGPGATTAPTCGAQGEEPVAPRDVERDQSAALPLAVLSREVREHGRRRHVAERHGERKVEVVDLRVQRGVAWGSWGAEHSVSAGSAAAAVSEEQGE